MKVSRIIAHFLLVTCLGLFVVGCTALQQKRRQPQCRALYDLIDSTWTRDEAAGIYRLYRYKPDAKSPIVDDILRCQECFTALSQADMTKIFGTPDTTFRGHMAYFLGEPCLTTDGIGGNGCMYLQCTFGADKTARAVEFVYQGFK